MFKRRLSLLLVLALALNFVAILGMGSPARAAESPSLASYAPPDTVIFVTARIDDAFIDTLDGLRAKVVDALPAGAVPGMMNFRALISMAATSGGLNYEKDIRSWLGDNMAFFVSNPEMLVQRGGNTPEDVTAAFVVDIKDRAVTVKFVDNLLAKTPSAKGMFTKADEATYTVYRSTEGDKGTKAFNSSTAIAINDNALIIGTIKGVDAAMGTRAKLFEQEGFKSALALLPETKYNALIYIDTGALFKLGVQANMRLSSASNPNAEAMANAFVDAIGPTVVGATILDDRTLTLDMAQKLGDTSGLEKLGVTLPKLTPIKASFAANIPATAAGVVEGSNLAGIIDYALTNVVSLSKLQSQADAERVAAQIKRFEDEFLKNTGIDFREDIVSWMTGDFALISGYTSPKPGTATLLNSQLFPKLPVENAVDAGMIFEVTDKAKVDTLVAKLETLIAVGLKNNKEVTLTKETIGGAKVLVLSGTAPLPSGQSTKLEFVIGANDKVLVLATRPLAEAILTGAPGLDTSAAFKAASVYLVPQPTAIAYLSNDGVNLLGDLGLLGAISDNLGRAMRGQPEQTQQKFVEIQTQLRTFLALIESATVSSTTDASGSTISRAVITLAK